MLTSKSQCLALLALCSIISLAQSSSIKGYQHVHPRDEPRSIKLSPANNIDRQHASRAGQHLAAPVYESMKPQSSVPILESTKRLYNDELLRRQQQQQRMPVEEVKPSQADESNKVVEAKSEPSVVKSTSPYKASEEPVVSPPKQQQQVVEASASAPVEPAPVKAAVAESGKVVVAAAAAPAEPAPIRVESEKIAAPVDPTVIKVPEPVVAKSAPVSESVVVVPPQQSQAVPDAPVVPIAPVVPVASDAPVSPVAPEAPVVPAVPVVPDQQSAPVSPVVVPSVVAPNEVAGGSVAKSDVPAVVASAAAPVVPQPAPVPVVAVQQQPQVQQVSPVLMKTDEDVLTMRKDDYVDTPIEVPAPDPGLVLSEPIDSTTKLLIDLDEHVQKFLPIEEQHQPQPNMNQNLVAGIDYSPSMALDQPSASPKGLANAPLSPYSGNDDPIVPPLPSLVGVEQASPAAAVVGTASAASSASSSGSSSSPATSSSSASSPSLSATRQSQNQNQQQVINQLLDQLDALQARIQVSYEYEAIRIRMKSLA